MSERTVNTQLRKSVKKWRLYKGCQSGQTHLKLAELRLTFK
ncbi:hypothetical protein [Scytonema sp. UIC 10036]|nr:hypothetical protein [Scytonema sp. UIC 10036]